MYTIRPSELTGTDYGTAVRHLPEKPRPPPQHKAYKWISAIKNERMWKESNKMDEVDGFKHLNNGDGPTKDVFDVGASTSYHQTSSHSSNQFAQRLSTPFRTSAPQTEINITPEINVCKPLNNNSAGTSCPLVDSSKGNKLILYNMPESLKSPPLRLLDVGSDRSRGGNSMSFRRSSSRPQGFVIERRSLRTKRVEPLSHIRASPIERRPESHEPTTIHIEPFQRERIRRVDIIENDITNKRTDIPVQILRPFKHEHQHSVEIVQNDKHTTASYIPIRRPDKPSKPTSTPIDMCDDTMRITPPINDPFKELKIYPIESHDCVKQNGYFATHSADAEKYARETIDLVRIKSPDRDSLDRRSYTKLPSPSPIRVRNPIQNDPHSPTIRTREVLTSYKVYDVPTHSAYDKQGHPPLSSPISDLSVPQTQLKDEPRSYTGFQQPTQQRIHMEQTTNRADEITKRSNSYTNVVHRTQSMNRGERLQNAVKPTITNQTNATPYRAVSQTNIPGQYSLGQPQWTSDLNIRTTTTYKTAPIQSNYSAHRENMQRKEEQRRLMECEQPHVRHYDDSQRAMGSEVLEEVETITLQPIGRGVHDLEPTGSINRSFRANTPTVSRGFTPGPEISDGYRTIGTSNTHRDHISGAASPFVGVRHGSFLETGGKTSEHRYRATQQSDSHWRATTVPPNYEGSLGGGVHESTDSADWEQALLRRVKDTYREWYLPDKTREEVESLLRDREPGSFLIRNSVSAGRSFSVALKTSVQQPSTSESFRPGPVKHYMVSSVATADGYEAGLQVQGFSGQPIFTDLVSFVHHHCMQPGPFPCVLRLPMELAFHHQRFAHHGTGIKMRPAQAGGGLDVEMFYLGSVQVDKLHSMAAIRKAVTKILSLASTSGKVLSKRCEVIVQARPKHGVQFNGRTKRGKVEELLKANDISFCGMDPEGRTYTDEDLRLRGMIAAKVFGIVVRSKSVWMHGNRVYVFSEVNPNQSALTLVNYVNQLFLP